MQVFVGSPLSGGEAATVSEDSVVMTEVTVTVVETDSQLDGTTTTNERNVATMTVGDVRPQGTGALHAEPETCNTMLTRMLSERWSERSAR